MYFFVLRVVAVVLVLVWLQQVQVELQVQVIQYLLVQGVVSSQKFRAEIVSFQGNESLPDRLPVPSLSLQQLVAIPLQ